MLLIYSNCITSPRCNCITRWTFKWFTVLQGTFLFIPANFSNFFFRKVIRKGNFGNRVYTFKILIHIAKLPPRKVAIMCTPTNSAQRVSALWILPIWGFVNLLTFANLINEKNIYLDVICISLRLNIFSCVYWLFIFLPV